MSFDLLVIGGGSGGFTAAYNAAVDYGKKVLLIEGGRMGGTCVNVGCVPKKIMFNTASIAESIHDAASYGFKINHFEFSWEAIKKKRDDYVKSLSSGYSEAAVHPNITVVNGWASFVDVGKVQVNGVVYSADKIILAPGSKPTPMPNIQGREFAINSDGFFELETQPKNVVIIGGGYIACELAGVFNCLGSKVNLVIRGDSPLRGFDEMIRKRFEFCFFLIILS